MTIMDELDEAQKLIDKISDTITRLKMMHTCEAVDAVTEKKLKDAIDG